MPLEPQPPAAPAPLGAQQIRTKIHQIARRQLWLWSSGMMVTLLLTLGVASFAFPGLLSEPEAFYSFHLNLAIRGLVGQVELASSIGFPAPVLLPWAWCILLF
jgi:hypothetical protein